MPPTPEQEAREQIDALLEKAGWAVQDAKAANIHAATGVAIRDRWHPATALPITCSMWTPKPPE
jgi:hypothetical protein